MKTHPLLLILLLCSINLFAQTKYKYDYNQGYEFIDKARKNLQKGDLEKAEAFIEKAKASSYGFCGNAWASAHSAISIIEVQVFNKQKNYDKALTVLDSLGGCSFGADCDVRDSLKIVTLFLKFDKEKVKAAFKKANVVSKEGDSEYDHRYWVFLEDLNYKFRFNARYPLYLNGKKVEPEKTENEFYDLAKDRIFYKLLE